MLAARTHIVKSHLLFSSPSLTLEEHGLSVVAFGAHVVLRAGQSGVTHHVRVNVRQLIDFVHDFVHINAVRVGLLFVVAISARVQENFVVFVFPRIQHVVAFLAELNADVAGSSVFSRDADAHCFSSFCTGRIILLNPKIQKESDIQPISQMNFDSLLFY